MSARLNCISSNVYDTDGASRYSPDREICVLYATDLDLLTRQLPNGTASYINSTCVITSDSVTRWPSG